MELTKPKVYLIAHTDVRASVLSQYLKDIGNPNWHPNNTHNGDTLVEAAGRMCYRSWQPYDPNKPMCSNPNVEKTRTDSMEYLNNILRSGHGSVLEHVNMTFIVRDCSRVVTHELVRHRAGCAYSQESLRYVRLDNLRFMWPNREELGLSKEDAAFLLEQVKNFEDIQGQLIKRLIKPDMAFAEKKKLTSFMRRFAPIGLATSIMFTANVRALRHMIAMRTSLAAETEIRGVFLEVAQQASHICPGLFQDMTVNEDNTCTFDNPKV